MNRIVRDHYPVLKLPEDLRKGLGASEEVRVTIEPDRLDESEHLPAAEGTFSQRYKHVRRNNFGSVEEVVAYVRSLRD